MVVSHDRWFLDRIATHILAYEGDSQVNFFEGNYTDYEADRNANYVLDLSNVYSDLLVTLNDERRLQAILDGKVRFNGPGREAPSY